MRAAVRQPGLPAPGLYGSASAVAAQALRRVGAEAAPDAAPTGSVTVLLSGRTATLPDTALGYPEGLLLQAVTPAH